MHRFRKKISMEIPGSPVPSSYVAVLGNLQARCPVQLYEATGSSSSWMAKGAAGELHVKSLGNTVLFLQLLSLSDSRLLFEDTIYNPDSLIVLSPRFFAIQLKNGNFQGFGFSDSAAASEMKEHISKAFKPYNLEDHSDRKSLKEMSVVKEEDNCSVSWISAANDSKSEEKGFAVPSLELVTYSQTVKSSKWRFSWKWLTSFPYSRNWDSISGAYGWQEHEMQIGYPTDVKHVAHIGWEGPSVCGPSWIEELKLSPDHAKRSPRELDQALGFNRTHETLLPANCTSIGMDTIGQKDQFGSLPAPPAMYLDVGMPRLQKKHSWWNVSWLLHRSRDSSADKIRSCQA